MLIIAITCPTFYSWVGLPTHSELVLLVSLRLPCKEIRHKAGLSETISCLAEKQAGMTWRFL